MKVGVEGDLVVASVDGFEAAWKPVIRTFDLAYPWYIVVYRVVRVETDFDPDMCYEIGRSFGRVFHGKPLLSEDLVGDNKARMFSLGWDFEISDRIDTVPVLGRIS